MNSNENEMKFNILINNQLMVGTIAFRPYKKIHKVLASLKKIQLLQQVEQGKVKYMNDYNVEIPSNDSFMNQFNINLPINNIKLFVPEQSINMTEEKRKFMEYRQNRQLTKSIRSHRGYSQQTDLSAILSQIYDQKESIKQQQHLQRFSVDVRSKQIIYKFIMEIQKQRNRYNILKDAISIFVNNQHRFLSSHQLLCPNSSTPSNQNLLNDNQRKQLFNDNQWKQLQTLIKKIADYNQTILNQREQFLKIINDLTHKISKHSQQTPIGQINVVLQQKQPVRKHTNQIQQHETRQIKQIQQHGTGQTKQIQIQKQFNQLQIGRQVDAANEQISAIQIVYKNRISSLQLQFNQLMMKYRSNEDQIKFYLYVLDTSLLAYQVLSNKEANQPFMSQLSQYISNITQLRLLYSHQRERGSNDRFHKLTDNHQNIVLIAKTIQGKIFGAFSNMPFTPHLPQIHQEVRSFLFNIQEGNLNIFTLKANHLSVFYDEKYIIFGNQQICLNRLTNQVQSLFTTLGQRHLHYNDIENKRQHFLSDKDCLSEMQLTNFQVYQIKSL